jgi:voltage-gated potassium channel
MTFLPRADRKLTRLRLPADLPLRYVLVPLIPLVLILIGTLGYYFIEDWSLFDSLYMTVITLTTVGYNEVHELSHAGRVFTMLLLLGGVFTLIYTATEIIRAVVGGELRTALGKQLMERNLAALNDHLIICGFGRMGRQVCQEFSTQELPFVVIEREAAALEDFQLAHGIALHGDATADEILRRAGVERARALVSVVASDADNLFITMSARLLNDKLFIVARAENDKAEQKLVRAGANRVVSPYVIGGFRVAQAVLRPTVVDFIELATRTQHLELQIEETRIAARSSLAGTTLRDSRLRQDRGIIIVAIKKASGQMVFNPPAEAVMEADDVLIVLGHRQQLNHLERLAGAAETTTRRS